MIDTPIYVLLPRFRIFEGVFFYKKNRNILCCLVLRAILEVIL